MKNSNKILHYLLQKKDWVKASELSTYLSISQRQVRKYISTINDKEQIIISSSQGYKVDKKKYDAFVYRQKHMPTEQEKRHEYIIQKLITHPQGYNIFDFSDELYVSETTIKKDIHIIKSVIQKYKLVIARNKNIIQLLGNEECMRKLIYSFISDYSFNTQFFQEGFHLFEIQYDYNEIQLKLKEAMKHYHLVCNDFSLNNLTTHLIIILNRVESGYQLLESIEDNQIIHSNSYRVALMMNDYFMEEYGILFNKSELTNISLIIANNVSQSNMINYDNLNLRNIHKYVDNKYIEITKNIIQMVEENYYLFPFKESFISKFILHIQNLFFRAHNNFHVKNPLADTIKMSYPLIYDIAVFIAQQIKQNYDIYLNEDEIAFISFHIGSYFEGNSFTKMTRVNCAFIYIEYYDFYKTTLKNLCQRFDDKIAITKISSISDYIDEINSDIDLLILATGINTHFKTKSVYMKPFPDLEDYHKIEEIIDEISFIKQRNELKDYILNFFNEQLFYKNPPFFNKEETLLQMTTDLSNLNYTGEDFYNDVLNREALSSTAFHDIAVPHSLTAKSTHKSFISIALFDEGILWSENKYVHVVAIIGINDHSRKIFSKFFDQLIDMLDNPVNIQKLLNANNFDEFFYIINMLFSSNK